MKSGIRLGVCGFVMLVLLSLLLALPVFADSVVPASGEDQGKASQFGPVPLPPVNPNLAPVPKEMPAFMQSQSEPFPLIQNLSTEKGENNKMTLQQIQRLEEKKGFFVGIGGGILLSFGGLAMLLKRKMKRKASDR